MRLRSAAMLAWRLLTHDRARLRSSVAGVAFAVLIMLLQLAFRTALLDSSLALLRALDADLIVLHRDKMPFLARVSMPDTRVYQTRAVEGVAAAYPFWIGAERWRNPEDGTERRIRLIAFEPDKPVFRADDARFAGVDWGSPDAAFLDSKSRRCYGPIAEGPAVVAREAIHVRSLFTLGTDFEMDGNLIVSPELFERLTGSSTRAVAAALVKTAADADVDDVADRLRAALPGDVSVQTKTELIARDVDYWDRRTPVSFILLAGLAIGFAAGIVICYQILYTDVLDHLAEFATVVAMGYSRAHVLAVVGAESVLLSVMGFVPAVIVNDAINAIVSDLTGLPMQLTWRRLAMVLGLTVAMSMAAGAAAAARMKQSDPAELF